MEKITVSLDPGDREVIDKIIASDHLEGVRTPEQALLWSLKAGKLFLDGFKYLTIEPVEDPFSWPGIDSVKADLYPAAAP